jgi:hypothetical protein
VKAADTSFVVAAVASWHERHDVARRVLDGGVRLIEHCALETSFVVTPLPPPHRSPGTVVRDFIQSRFREPFLRLSAQAYKGSFSGCRSTRLPAARAQCAGGRDGGRVPRRARHLRQARGGDLRELGGPDQVSRLRQKLASGFFRFRHVGRGDCSELHRSAARSHPLTWSRGVAAW